MTQSISIKARSELVTAKSGRKYFTVTDLADVKYICYNTSLYGEFSLGKEVSVDVEIQEGKTPQIRGIAQTAEKPPEIEKAGIIEVAKIKDPLLTSEVIRIKDPQRTSIERQKALDIAEHWAEALLHSGKKDLSGGKILELAKLFEKYLDTGRVPESKLEQEAKKLGAEPEE